MLLKVFIVGDFIHPLYVLFTRHKMTQIKLKTLMWSPINSQKATKEIAIIECKRKLITSKCGYAIVIEPTGIKSKYERYFIKNGYIRG